MAACHVRQQDTAHDRPVHARQPDAAHDRPVSIANDRLGDAAPAPLLGRVVVNDRNLPTDRWGDDPYELSTGDAHAMADDTLTLTLSYSGGCARHDFTLAIDPEFVHTEPAKIGASLVHDANGDRCEAYPTERYAFDLTPIKWLYRQTFARNDGTIRLRVRMPGRSGESPAFVYVVR